MEFTKGKKTHVKHYVFKIIGINLVKAELTVTNGSYIIDSRYLKRNFRSLQKFSLPAVNEGTHSQSTNTEFCSLTITIDNSTCFWNGTKRDKGYVGANEPLCFPFTEVSPSLSFHLHVLF